MLADGAHISIDGIHLELEEDMEGHYVYKQEQLLVSFWVSRPIGGYPGKEDIRRDLMYWDNTDWSGGEGEKFFSPDDPHAYYYSTDANTRNPGYLAVRPTRTVVTVN